MTPATREVVTDALDQALAAHVCKLYGVLMSDGGVSGAENGLARFWRGLNRAVGMHEELVQAIVADDSEALNGGTDDD